MRDIFSKRWTARLLAMPLPLAALALPGLAHAGGFYLQEQSVKGAGRAYSGEVADTGAGSLWWNPAAIGGLQGGDAAIGFSAILPHSDVNNNGSTITYPAPIGTVPLGGSNAHDPINKGYLPSGSIAHAISKSVAVGLTITSPYSFETDYADGSWAAYTAGKTRLRTYDIQPSFAVTPTEGLSIGGAINFERSVATLTNYLPNFLAAPGTPDGTQTLHGTGWDLGFTLGVQWHQGPLSLGASYKSGVSHHLDGQVTIAGLAGLLLGQNAVIPTQANFRTPWQASLGARYAVTPALTLNAQVVRFGWSDFDAIRFAAPLTALPIAENYRDTWSFAVGADYAVTSKWTLRAGVQRDETPTQNGARDARVPDGSRWNFAAGTSLDVTKGFTVDAAVNYLAVANASIDRPSVLYPYSPAQTIIGTSGTLSNASVLVLSIGGRLRF